MLFSCNFLFCYINLFTQWKVFFILKIYFSWNSLSTILLSFCICNAIIFVSPSLKIINIFFVFIFVWYVFDFPSLWFYLLSKLYNSWFPLSLIYLFSFFYFITWIKLLSFIRWISFSSYLSKKKLWHCWLLCVKKHRIPFSFYTIFYSLSSLIYIYFAEFKRQCAIGSDTR